jgi:6-phosphogluconolactonase
MVSTGGNSELQAEIMIEERLFSSTVECNRAVAEFVADRLRRSIETSDQASMAVSGGRTPVGVFSLLSETDLAWDQVFLTTIDERWVSTEDEASNERLVRDHLMQDKAARARFTGMKTDHHSPKQGRNECAERISRLPSPLDMVYLGMGEDGHIASLFPGSPALSDNDALVVPGIAPQEPTARMSLSLEVLAQAREVCLHLVGDAKRQVYQRSVSARADPNLPFAALLARRTAPVRVFLAEV